MRRKKALFGASVFAAGAAVSYAVFVRPHHLRFGASEEEVAAGLPGDELIERPTLQATRAITIHARPADVWSFLVQLGADRAGFYSYDALENLFGLDIHSADDIVPAWQGLKVGDLVAADQNARGGWFVERLEPERALVLRMGDPVSGTRFTEDMPPIGTFTWAFVLRELADGSTRLLVRARYGTPGVLARLAVEPIELVDFVMTERMLRGIRDRAERHAKRPDRTAA